MAKNTRQTGSGCDTTAALFLEGQNYVILERNYRCRRGEIDIIARDGSCLVFAEVKYRHSGAAGDPLEAVDRRKQKRICYTALWYLQAKNIDPEGPIRFDVIGMTDNDIIHIKNAFDFTFS